MVRKSNYIQLTAAAAFAAAIASLPAGAARADTTQQPVEQTVAAETHAGTGEVTKIDSSGGRIELKHGPIASLQWPEMRMSFKVVDAQVLKGIEVGDQVKFVLVKTSNGALEIGELHKAE